jgi:hypothetical protein
VARGWRNNVVEIQKKFHDVEGGKRKKGERRRKRVKVPFGSTGYATGYSTVERVGWASGSGRSGCGRARGRVNEKGGVARIMGFSAFLLVASQLARLLWTVWSDRRTNH